MMRERGLEWRDRGKSEEGREGLEERGGRRKTREREEGREDA